MSTPCTEWMMAEPVAPRMAEAVDRRPQAMGVGLAPRGGAALVVCVLAAQSATRLLLRDVFQSRGVIVHPCASPEALWHAVGQCGVSSGVRVLVDLSSPGGVQYGQDVLQRLRGLRPGVAVMALVDRGHLDLAVQAMRAGAQDVMEKPFVESQLLARLHALQSPGMRSSVLDRPARTDLLSGLTMRELEILSLLAQGLTSKEAGRQLGISPRTVDVHRARILAKMQATSTVAAMSQLRQLDPEMYEMLIHQPMQLYRASTAMVTAGLGIRP